MSLIDHCPRRGEMGKTVGGSKSLVKQFCATGGGARAKNRSFKRCGEIYRRVHWNNRGKKSIVWRCASRLEEKGSDCGSPTVSEEDLQKAVLKAINSIIAGRNEFIATLRRNIETALGGEFDESTEAIDKKLDELQHELLRLVNRKAAYDSVANEIYRLRELRQETLASNAERQNRRQRIAEMMKFLESQSGVIFEYDEKLVRRLIERAMVFEDKLTVVFKSGIEFKVSMI